MNNYLILPVVVAVVAVVAVVVVVGPAEMRNTVVGSACSLRWLRWRKRVRKRSAPALRPSGRKPS